MATMTMTTTHDDKIMNFDVANGYDAFMKLFNEDEIAEMRDWLEGDECGYDYSWATGDEANEGIVIDYVKEWLVQNIRNMTYSGTEQLFKIIYNM